MSYAAIDPILTRWADKHRLTIATEYKDSTVRSTDVVSRTGKKAQIWIDSPQETGRIAVHVWDYRKRRADLIATGSDLERTLERALEFAREWVEADQPR